MQVLLSQLQQLMQTARDTYHVDPVIFLVIYLACAPIWYYSMYRSIRSVATRRANEIILWSTIFLASSVAPFIYVALFGRNLPWWVYAVITTLIVEGIFSVIRRLRQRPQTS